MATDSQTTANQLNSQKCTGPVTPGGKTKSSQNALKTGLYAKSDVIATENRDDYETLIAEYHARFNPATPEERCLVDDLIRAEWLGRRYMAATTAILGMGFPRQERSGSGPDLHSPVRSPQSRPALHHRNPTQLRQHPETTPGHPVETRRTARIRPGTCQ